jgi:hypothetical protein
MRGAAKSRPNKEKASAARLKQGRKTVCGLPDEHPSSLIALLRRSVIMSREQRPEGNSGLLNKEMRMSREDDDFFDVDTSTDDNNDEVGTSESILNDTEDGDIPVVESIAEQDEPSVFRAPSPPRAKPKPKPAAKKAKAALKAKPKAKPKAKAKAKPKAKTAPKKKAAKPARKRAVAKAAKKPAKKKAKPAAKKKKAVKTKPKK